MARDRPAASRPLRTWLAGVQHGFQQGLAGALDLPRDAIRDLPRLTLIGQGELVVENHRGVALFDRERVLVELPGGRLEVCGHRLVIDRIDREELVVTGRIDVVRFLPEAGGDRR